MSAMDKKNYLKNGRFQLRGLFRLYNPFSSVVKSAQRSQTAVPVNRL